MTMELPLNQPPPVPLGVAQVGQAQNGLRQSPYSYVDEHGGTHGYPYPRDEAHRQALLAQWNTRHRGTPAPDFLRKPMASPEEQGAAYGFRARGAGAGVPGGQGVNSRPDLTPQEYMQNWRDQLAQRQAGAAAGAADAQPEGRSPFNPYASDPRIVGPANNGALGPGQYRAHPMLPGGVGVGEIPTPWRGVDIGDVREDDMLRSRARRLYNPYEGLNEQQAARLRELMQTEGITSAARGKEGARQQAQATARRLADIRERRAAAMAARAAPLREAAGGDAGALTDEQLVAQNRYAEQGLLPPSQRGALVREKAQRRTSERMDRIANRNAVPTMQERLAMAAMQQDPGVAGQLIGANAARDIANIRGGVDRDVANTRAQADRDVAELNNQRQEPPIDPIAAAVTQALPENYYDLPEAERQQIRNDLYNFFSGGQQAPMQPGQPMPQGAQGEGDNMLSPPELQRVDQMTQGLPSNAAKAAAILRYAEQNGWSEGKTNLALRQLGRGFSTTSPAGSTVDGLTMETDPVTGERYPNLAPGLEVPIGMNLPAFAAWGVGQAARMNPLWGDHLGDPETMGDFYGGLARRAIAGANTLGQMRKIMRGRNQSSR